MPTEDKSRLGPFVYVWLAISVLLNISGIASIVDDFVTWAGFFRDFIDFYRAWIREPILWVAHLVWPSGWPRIPGWVADWLCINASFFLAFNILSVYNTGTTAFGAARQVSDLTDAFHAIAYLLPILLLGPLGMIGLHYCIQSPEDTWEQAWGTVVLSLLYWLLLLGTVLFLMFLNWQGQKLGYW